MRLARKLLLLAGMALTALAMTATPASAQIEVYDEHNNDEHCDVVDRVGHTAVGGCHIEFESIQDIPLHAYIPQKITASNCEVYLEGVIDEQGEGFVTETIFDPPHAGDVPCTREPCEEEAGPGDHPMTPWPFHIREHGADDEEVEAEFCLQAADSEGPGAWCDIHLEFASLGAHQYEIGHAAGDGDGTEVFCENNVNANPPYTGPHAITPAPTSIEAHFHTTGTEELGIVH